MNVFELLSLKGKTAVITGGSIGLGAQMATSLAEAGANVVVAARKVERCVALCNELEKLGVKALPAACDVGKTEDCQNLIDLTVKEFGKVDILVNNAGITWAADSLNYPMDKWDKVFNVNIRGLYELSVMAAKVMKENGGGKIINIASIAGFLGSEPELQDTIAYQASKGAVVVLTKDLAVKWARYGITVNAIAPGYFPTHMSSGLLEMTKDQVLPRIPLRRFGRDHDIKGLALLLASPASDFITGQTYIIDGGMTAG
ncbi:MAG: SDR family oxidoreductase [Syntrophomonadaceae bacterium]|nr:SDR family oxidoreductase [Syntrophomonadaceae bacterium]